MENYNQIFEIRPNDLSAACNKRDGFPGVYCWGYYEDDIFIPLYVGKSRNVFERLIQHYCRFKSGEYRIFSAKELREIYILKTSNRQTVSTVYEPDSFKSVVFSLPLHVDHERMTVNFAFRCTFIPDDSARIIAERSLANYLGRGRLITDVPRGGDSSLCPSLLGLVSPVLETKRG